MGEVEIIPIPCDDYDLRELRLIEALLKIAKTLNIETSKSETETQGVA